MVVVVNQRAPVLDRYLYVFALQLGAVLIAEDRQQQLVAHGRLERLPIDVEILGVLRGMPILQHVLPPDGIVAHAHVIGHNIEQQAQTLAAQFRGESGKAVGSAELRVEAVVTGHVIAVHAVGPGFKNG